LRRPLEGSADRGPGEGDPDPSSGLLEQELPNVAELADRTRDVVNGAAGADELAADHAPPRSELVGMIVALEGQALAQGIGERHRMRS
jgi:hypothetical protein